LTPTTTTVSAMRNALAELVGERVILAIPHPLALSLRERGDQWERIDWGGARESGAALFGSNGLTSRQPAASPTTRRSDPDGRW
jgi:hypothetical protein